jgi:hypothetical protein
LCLAQGGAQQRLQSAGRNKFKLRHSIHNECPGERRAGVLNHVTLPNHIQWVCLGGCGYGKRAPWRVQIASLNETHYGEKVYHEEILRLPNNAGATRFRREHNFIQNQVVFIYPRVNKAAMGCVSTSVEHEVVGFLRDERLLKPCE